MPTAVSVLRTTVRTPAARDKFSSKVKHCRLRIIANTAQQLRVGIIGNGYRLKGLDIMISPDFDSKLANEKSQHFARREKPSALSPQRFPVPI
jgi:hypothetical protein